MLPGEAERALGEIEAGRRRAFELRGYAAAGSTLIAWGLVWVAANMVVQFVPRFGALAWGAGIVAALVWTFTRPRQLSEMRVLVTWLVLSAYVATIIAIAGAAAPLSATIIALSVAAAYVVLGIWAGLRFAVLGAILAAIALLAWTLSPGLLFLWLALGGGGTLILGGLWLVRA